MFLQTEGRLAGCWVMPIEEDADRRGRRAGDVEADAIDGDEQREKVIVRSERHRHLRRQGHRLPVLEVRAARAGLPLPRRSPRGWPATRCGRRPATGRRCRTPTFGRAHAVYNVIDTRQSYLQKLLKQALATLGHRAEADRSTHFSYEMVALSHRTARELGYTGQDESKPFVEVSGRKGLGVKADDLLDRLIAKARVEVEARNPR